MLQLDYHDYRIVEGEYMVYSLYLNRYFYGDTLTVARARRDDAEYITRKHLRLNPTEQES